MKRAAALAVLASLAGCASLDDRSDERAALVPSRIPAGRSALEALTAELRGKRASLGLNNQPGLGGERVSRALVLLPRDRARAGVVSFELEAGPRAGVHQCEALGRGKTATEKKNGWIKSELGGRAIYYAKMTEENGATLPGVYDVRNISPDDYEIQLMNSAAELAGEADVVARTRSADPASKPHFSGAWRTWYPRSRPRAMPIDMLWSRDYQSASQGADFPVFERRPQPKSEAERAFQEKQLARDKEYYRGPFGRSGLATHTDRWDEPERAADPKLAGRPELSDFRWRDTNGCLKVRADCLELLNEFVAEQAGKGRRVQYDVRQTSLLDRVPAL